MFILLFTEDSIETSSSSGTMSPNMNKSEYMSFSSPVNVIPGVSTADSSTTTTESVALPSVPPKTPFSASSHSIRNNRFESKDINKPSRPSVSSRSHRDRLWLNLDRPIQETRFVGKNIILFNLVLDKFIKYLNFYVSLNLSRLT